jgi:hypothetical protein
VPFVPDQAGGAAGAPEAGGALRCRIHCRSERKGRRGGAHSSIYTWHMDNTHLGFNSNNLFKYNYDSIRVY